MRPLHIHLILCLLTSISGATPEYAAKLNFFESKIRPVLVKQCYTCHSVEAGKSKGELLLDSRAAWEFGGESGPAILPGKPEESPLFKAISRSGVIPEMPPKSHLPDDVIEDFRKWIADGAVDPREGEAPTHEKKTIDIEKWKSFWSFKPREVGKTKGIDTFIKPAAPRAPTDKLLRRLYLDLIGLPPTPTERAIFLKRAAANLDTAIETTTDELLARKGFGEKWARHWLDVARYADSNGGDFNLTFHEAWRYRNYVIDAFNDDMPYDQFLREQIAGDLLPAETPADSDRQHIATGYLMLASKMLTERDKAKMHLDIADEQLDTIGRSIMGLTLGCARCHDHKFDPIPTKDYYALAGILHSTRTADKVLMGNVNITGWTDTDLSMDEATKAKIEANRVEIAGLEKKIAEQKKAKKEEAKTSARAIVVDNPEATKTGPWRTSTHRPNHVGKHYLASDPGNAPVAITWTATLPKPGTYDLRVSFSGGGSLAKNAPYRVQHAKGETLLKINQTQKPEIDGLWHSLGRFEFNSKAIVALTDSNVNAHVLADAIQLVHEDHLEKVSPSSNLKALEAELKSLKAKAPKVPKAMAAMDTTKRLGDLHIRVRGESRNRGPKVPRGFLQVVHLPESGKLAIPDNQSGRVQLAEWMTHPDHPLTARVMVNRIWQQFFGRGIVLSSDNFGALGTPPTHPELLDYLAEQFVTQGWSVKTLIREIVASKTYQQTAATASETDPDNARLKHQSRRPAPAETIRDSILAIGGKLDREQRGSAVSALGNFAIQTTGQRHASVGKTGTLRQRSIYLPIIRGAVPPSLEVFDLPNPDLVTGTRDVTTVPAQALFMMNAPFVREMATAVAERICAEENTADAIVQRLYAEILIREADQDDQLLARTYIKALESDGHDRPAAVASFVQVLFSSTEFRFVE